MTRRTTPRSIEYALARIALLVVGSVGAIVRALPLHHKPDDTIPVVDGVTLAWVGLAAIGLLLPMLKTLTLGVISMSFKDEQRNDAHDG